MYKYFIAAILMLFAASCTMKPKINLVNNNYETEYSEVKIQTPKISIPNEKEFSEKLNNMISDKAEEAAEKFEKKVISSDIADKGVFDMLQRVNYNKNDFISITEELYTYTGGAHGMTVRHTRNIDILRQCEITLEDLFAEEGYKDTLKRMINEEIEENQEEYSELWQKPEIKSNQDFYITDDLLVIYYQPYELSYYARGFVEFPLRLPELKGYLKEEYYRILL